MRRKLIYLSYLLIYVSHIIQCKYLEGELHTSENWAFIARFCFLSDDGEFEYYIEYGEEQGEPNLLLYYDSDDQWPAVYKTDKTCLEKEDVLKIGQNQIINLTSIYPWREASGCTATPIITTQAPKHSVKIPTLPVIKRRTTKKTTTAPKETTKTPITDFPSTIITKNYSSTQETTTESSVTPLEVQITTKTEELVTLKEENDLLTTINDDSKRSLQESTILVETSTISQLLASGQTSSVKETFYPAYSTENKLRKKRYATHNIKYFRSNRTVICTNARRFRSSRERWWFIAISNCNGAKGIHIKYKILMTNGGPGDYWHEHFSADEFYVLPVLMAFSVAYSFLILAIVICSIELKSRQLLHSTYKLFVFSAIVQFFGILFRSMCYLKYAVNGIGSTSLKITGSSFMAISETTFLLLLLLLAKGYTVTRGRLPMAAGVKLTIFMCLYVVTYVTLFIYEAQVFDPGEVLYTYESPAGYGLIILRIIAWCMFIYSTVFTLKHYPEKANFYYPFNVFGTLWFIAGPAFIISANTYIDKWVRESVVCAVLLFITFGGHLMFLLLTMPSVANKNFPYHVRTTQIGVMEINGLAGNSSIEQFGHHVYAPISVDQTVIVPLTRRTEEIFGGLYSQQMHTNIQNEQIRNDQIGNDLVMNNVLTWSTAKNFSTIGAMQFETATLRNRNIDDNFNEERGRVLEITNGEAINEEGRAASNLNDWVKEVPVELFTISKLVVKKEDKNKPAISEE